MTEGNVGSFFIYVGEQGRSYCVGFSVCDLSPPQKAASRLFSTTKCSQEQLAHSRIQQIRGYAVPAFKTSPQPLHSDPLCGTTFQRL